MSLNPRIDGKTPVIVQGISGRAGRLHSRLMREYGTNIVGGVSPKMETREVHGVPLFPDCQTAVKATGATASVALGHAGALVHGSHGTFAAKRAALEAAGARVFGSLNEMVAGVCAQLR